MSDRDRFPQPAPEPRPGQELRSGAVCRRLRWKSMFMDVEPDDIIPSMIDGFVWCEHSQNCLGPDGGVAEPETCQPGRGCFES